MDHFIATAPHREPWNKGKIVGQKAPLKLKDIWAIRVRLQLSDRLRDLALFATEDATTRSVRDHRANARRGLRLNPTCKPAIRGLSLSQPSARVAAPLHATVRTDR
jgi:hypothetical protein